MGAIERIVGGRVLLPDGRPTAVDLSIRDGLLGEIGDACGAGQRVLRAEGLLVLPGIVDIHGDAFERQLAPRPEVRFPLAMAMHDTDRQLLANGITTAFHGITCSWESGLRSRDSARELIEHIGRRNGFGADHRVHLRFELHNLDAVEEVLVWMEEGYIDLLGFNDHLPAMRGRVQDTEKMSRYADRSGLSLDAFLDLLHRTASRGAEVESALAILAEAAGRLRIATASHDDMTRADRLRFQALGCGISEFPMREEAAHAAREFGNEVIMGAPNVVRGGSHLGGVRAADKVAEGVCTILASDYYYPALLTAPMRLVAERIAELGTAWSLVSKNPARAAGLKDRGEIVPGRRADLVLVDDADPRHPRVVATLVEGRLRHAAGAIGVI